MRGNGALERSMKSSMLMANEPERAVFESVTRWFIMHGICL